MIAARTSQFDRLFTDNYAYIVRYCRARLSDPHAAEDAAAETFRVAWVRFRAPATRAWLVAIARHVIGNEYRSRHRAQSLELRLGSVPLPAEVDRQRVRDAVQALDADDRRLLFLTYWVGLNATEVAGVLRISVPACWARLTRARRRVQQLLLTP